MEDYLYDSIIAAISRDDVSLLLYIWTRSFQRGREGIAVRQLIESGVKQISKRLGYNRITSFSILVRRWYWDEIEYLLENDLPALVELLRDTPYRAPSDAFVEYYPIFGYDSVTPRYAYDVGRLVYYLCLKSEKKEELQEVVGMLVDPVNRANEEDPIYLENGVISSDGIRQPSSYLLHGLYDLCSEEGWYEPLYILCRALLAIPNSDLELIIMQLVIDYEVPQEVPTHILRDIIHASVAPAVRANVLLFLISELPEQRLVTDLVREEASTELLYVLARLSREKEVDLGFATYPEEKKYAIIRMYFQRTVVDKMSKPYLRHFLRGKRGFAWFEPSFRFNREKYVGYFGEDDALRKVES